MDFWKGDPKKYLESKGAANSHNVSNRRPNRKDICEVLTMSSLARSRLRGINKRAINLSGASFAATTALPSLGRTLVLLYNATEPHSPSLSLVCTLSLTLFLFSCSAFVARDDARRFVPPPPHPRIFFRPFVARGRIQFKSASVYFKQTAVLFKSKGRDAQGLPWFEWMTLRSRHGTRQFLPKCFFFDVQTSR